MSRQSFYYPIDLHYSQTPSNQNYQIQQFYYPIDLHYSQTLLDIVHETDEFYYPIDLHYSQTDAVHQERRDVLLPYRFTLLSN